MPWPTERCAPAHPRNIVPRKPRPTTRAGDSSGGNLKVPGKHALRRDPKPPLEPFRELPGRVSGMVRPSELRALPAGPCSTLPWEPPTTKQLKPGSRAMVVPKVSGHCLKSLSFKITSGMTLIIYFQHVCSLGARMFPRNLLGNSPLRSPGMPRSTGHYASPPL